MTYILVEFECQTKGCDFVSLSLTQAYSHIGQSPEPDSRGLHNIEPRAYLRNEPLKELKVPMTPELRAQFEARTPPVDHSGHVPAEPNSPNPGGGETVDVQGDRMPAYPAPMPGSIVRYAPFGNPPNADSAVLGQS